MKIFIPEIHSSKVLVAIVDELKYKLKCQIHVGPDHEATDSMLKDFNKSLNGFIAKWNLGSDPHNFATLPTEKEKP